MEIRIAGLSDIAGVLDLQKLYLYDNLTDDDRKHGFVTTPFTGDQVRSIISEKGLFIANDNGRIIAYIFAGSWMYYSQWPIFDYMTSFFPKLSFDNHLISTEHSFQYGPVCIDVNYRGKELLKSLFEVMRVHMLQHYPFGATFINKVNLRSLNAHVKKLGWKVIGEFQYNDKDYHILAYDMSKPVDLDEIPITG